MNCSVWTSVNVGWLPWLLRGELGKLPIKVSFCEEEQRDKRAQRQTGRAHQWVLNGSFRDLPKLAKGRFEFITVNRIKSLLSSSN
jgi:hypothetical protein